jgi:hypothetical protein
MEQIIMETLFEVYYKQCPHEKIKYALFDHKKEQGHIVLDSQMEIIFFRKGQYTKFVCDRGEFGDEFFFDTYDRAIQSLTINN